MPVYTTQFQSDPVRTDVTFFEHVNRNVQFPAYRGGNQMMGAAIAEQDNVGDPFLSDDSP